MRLSKTELRAELRRRRLELTDEERTLRSRALADRLRQAADWPNVRALHYFEPLHQFMEPDISPFITELEDAYPALQLFTPRLIEGEWRLVAVRAGQPPAEPRFDVVIVPALGFDLATLQRIGYGGGYYDRFLAAQPQARKIGVCFEQGRVKGLPAEPHDVPLDMIVTDRNSYPAPRRG